MTIRVRNLPSTVTNAQLDTLKAEFSHFGKVNKFEVRRDTTEVIIELESNENAAIKALNGTLVGTQLIEVEDLLVGGPPKPKTTIKSEEPQPPVDPHPAPHSHEMSKALMLFS